MCNSLQAGQISYSPFSHKGPGPGVESPHSTTPHDSPEGFATFAFGGGEIVSGPGAPGRKAGPGLQRPLQGARMQPPKPASARPHPPHAVGIGIATCEGVLDGVLEPPWP